MPRIVTLLICILIGFIIYTISQKGLVPLGDLKLDDLKIPKNIGVPEKQKVKIPAHTEIIETTGPFGRKIKIHQHIPEQEIEITVPQEPTK